MNKITSPSCRFVLRRLQLWPKTNSKCHFYTWSRSQSQNRVRGRSRGSGSRARSRDRKRTGSANRQYTYVLIHCILVFLADLSQPRSNLIVYLHGTVSRDFSPLFFGRKTPYGPLIVWMYEDKLKQFQEIVRFREISRRDSILLHVLLTFVTDISDSIFWIYSVNNSSYVM